MSGQRWSNAILESEWLALRLAIFRRANKTADKMPALAQQMIAIWDHAMPTSNFFVMPIYRYHNVSR